MTNNPTTEAHHTVSAYIGLGSNLCSPKQQLTQALTALNSCAQIHQVRASSFYESKAVGPEQPNYINAVARVDTTLNPVALLDLLQSIENTQGRKREIHWGARTLDLDLLLYGDQTINNDRLTVPHAFIKERNFVIIPLLEVSPLQALPDGTKIEALAQQLGHKDLRKTQP